MSWPPIPHHFDYDDEFLDDSPPDDSDEVVYVSDEIGAVELEYASKITRIIEGKTP